MNGKHVIAVFQPHRYTRLKNLWNEFLDAFSGVDKVIVTDVYAASEDPIDGINSEKFAKDLKLCSNDVPVKTQNKYWQAVNGAIAKQKETSLAKDPILKNAI